MQLSIIVPAYNESRYIAGSIKRIHDVMKNAKVNYEIVIVNDGSSDDTLYVADSLRSRYKNLRVVGYKKNRGKGGAILFGTRFVKGSYVAFIDADKDIDPKYLLFLLKNIGNADIAILSKNHPKSRTLFPAYRKVLSKGYYVLVRVLFNLPVSDTQVGCKMFRREVIRKVCPLISTKKFAFDLELLAYANKFNYKIREFPAVLNFSRDKGRIRLKNVARIFFDTLFVLYKIGVSGKK